MRGPLAAAGALVVAALVSACAAHAQSGADVAPHVTFSAGSTSIGAHYAGGCTNFPSHGICADPPGIVPGAPELDVTVGSTIAVTADTPLKDVGAHLIGGPRRERRLAVVKTGDLSYRIKLPASLPAESNVWFIGRWSKAGASGDAEYTARLLTPRPAVATRVRWRSPQRLRLTLACPKAAASGCAGTVSLRAVRGGALVARAPFSDHAAGTSRTLTVAVSASALGDLRRHGSTALEAIVAPTGGTPAQTRLRLPPAR
jgi:hypothetical protein